MEDYHRSRNATDDGEHQGEGNEYTFHGGDPFSKSAFQRYNNAIGEVSDL